MAFVQLKNFQKQTKTLNLKSIVQKCAWISERVEEFRQLFKIFACAVALPLANAEVERGFSLMNNVKTEKETD